MKYHLPVYLHSANYAEEFQETNDYRASFRLNMQCRDAICEAIDAHYKNNRLNEAAAHEVIEQFGYERTMVILANTVHKKDWDAVLNESPTDFSDFLKKLETMGVTVNTKRKYIRLKAPGQIKFTRCNSLKGDYTEQAIRGRIEGKRTVTPKRGERKPQPKVGLLIDIDAAIRSGKGAGYERWAKVFNLKQLSQAVLYLKEHGDMSYEELQERTTAAVTKFNELSAEIKDLESQMSDNGELQKQIVNYAKTRTVYAEYRKAGYSKKFREAHEAEILIHQAAKKYFDSLGTEKLPSVKVLREEYSKLLARKRKAYAEYKAAREEMKELYNVKSNVEHLLNISEPEPEREREKTRR